ncbi:MAG: hypothetical protein ACR2G6_07830 [Gemmatimonadaceae bacterium]
MAERNAVMLHTELIMPVWKTVGVVFAVVGIGALAGGVGAFAAGTVSRDPVSLNGYDWHGWSPDARETYLAGFLAGAAAHQAVRQRPAASAKRIAADAARLKRGGTLTFPFGANVYRSHLDDFYFYENRRVRTLIEALAEFNTQAREKP